MTPLPSIEIVYGMLQQEKKQRQGLEGINFSSKSSALLSKSIDLKVDAKYFECGNKGHTSDKYWHAIGFPSGIPGHEGNLMVRGEVAYPFHRVLGISDLEVMIGKEQLKWKWNHPLLHRNRVLFSQHSKLNNFLSCYLSHLHPTAVLAQSLAQRLTKNSIRTLLVMSLFYLL